MVGKNVNDDVGEAVQIVIDGLTPKDNQSRNVEKDYRIDM